LLMIPGVSSVFARVVNFIRSKLPSNSYMIMVKWVWWCFYVILFLESLRQVGSCVDLNCSA
jgi:hypothetical protein